MSQRSEQVIVPAREETRVVETTCDLCGKAGKGRNPWAEDTFDITEVEVSYTTGHSYGRDGGTHEIEEFDICPECWKTKFIPWMKEQGADPRRSELDW